MFRNNTLIKVNLTPDLQKEIGSHECIEMRYEFLSPDDICIIDLKTDITLDAADSLDVLHKSYHHRWLSVSAVDNWWKKQKGHYIPRSMEATPNFFDIGRFEARMDRLLFGINSGNMSLRVPIINETQFSQGRHRFWLFRQLGLTYFPAAIPNDLPDDHEIFN